MAKAPNPKIQTTEKFQISNYKSQIAEGVGHAEKNAMESLQQCHVKAA